VIATTGGLVSSVTVSCAEATLPAASVAVAVIVFAPWERPTCVEKVPPETTAVAPFTRTVVVMESETVPVTVTVDWSVKLPFAGEVKAMTGAVVSRVVVTEVAAVPKALDAVAVRRFEPWERGTEALKVPLETAATTPFTVTLTGLVPETEPVTVTVVWSPRLPFAGALIANVGAVPAVTVTCVEAEFPATSVAATTIELEPWAKGTVVLKEPLETVTA
jgi:hypothetical protein